MRLLIGFAAGALMAGCSHGALNGKMASWQGQPIDELIAAWGPPHRTEPAGTGTVYLWYDEVRVPLNTPEKGSVAAGDTDYFVRTQCQRILAVDSEGSITGWRWRGNNCDMLSPDIVAYHDSREQDGRLVAGTTARE
jgi:hypothetical protein